MQEVLRLARIGTFEWRADADQVHWSSVMRAIFGLPPQGPPLTYKDYIERVHPDDRSSHEGVVQRAFREGGPYESRHRIVQPDGRVRWVHSHGEAVQEGGRTVLMRGTTADVTDAVEAARLRELNEFKARFMSMAAHELRTPLTPLRLQVAILLQAHAARMEPEVRKALGTIQRNVERLVTLVDDVLQSARVQSEAIQLHRQPTDLAELAQAVGENFAAAAGEVGVRLEVAVPRLVADVDPARMEQVLSNLVTNALKFTPAGGRVQVTGHLAGNQALLQVRDTGRGMTGAQLERLFQPFAQVHGDARDRARGTGLGLYICKGLAEAHGGSIQAASDGEGKGSSFSVSLPASRQAPVPLPGRPSGAPDRFRELI